MTAFTRLWHRGYGKTVIGTLFVLAYLFPVYWMVATSLKSGAAIFATPPHLVPFPPVFEPYTEAVINNPATLSAIVDSVIISIDVHVRRPQRGMKIWYCAA